MSACTLDAAAAWPLGAPLLAIHASPPSARPLQEAREGIQRCVISQNTRDDSPEEVKRRAMADPEVQQIMSDPAMRMILEQMQKDPQALSECVWQLRPRRISAWSIHTHARFDLTAVFSLIRSHLKNPVIAQKIQKLIDVGLIAIR